MADDPFEIMAVVGAGKADAVRKASSARSKRGRKKKARKKKKKKAHKRRPVRPIYDTKAKRYFVQDGKRRIYLNKNVNKSNISVVVKNILTRSRPKNTRTRRATKRPQRSSNARLAPNINIQPFYSIPSLSGSDAIIGLRSSTKAKAKEEKEEKETKKAKPELEELDFSNIINVPSPRSRVGFFSEVDKPRIEDIEVDEPSEIKYETNKDKSIRLAGDIVNIRQRTIPLKTAFERAIRRNQALSEEEKKEQIEKLTRRRNTDRIILEALESGIDVENILNMTLKKIPEGGKPTTGKFKKALNTVVDQVYPENTEGVDDELRSQKQLIEDELRSQKQQQLIEDVGETKLIEDDGKQQQLIRETDEELNRDERTGSGHKPEPGGLWSNQINRIMNNHPEFLGTICRNELPLLEKFLDKFCFIMNTCYSDEPGEHWTAWYCDRNQDASLEFYDSFGRRPSKAVIDQVVKHFNIRSTPHMIKLKINSVCHQEADSELCGYHCIRFLKRRLKGRSFPLATHFTDQIEKLCEEDALKLIKEFKLV